MIYKTACIVALCFVLSCAIEKSKENFKVEMTNALKSTLLNKLEIFISGSLTGNYPTAIIYRP